MKKAISFQIGFMDDTNYGMFELSEQAARKGTKVFRSMLPSFPGTCCLLRLLTQT